MGHGAEAKKTTDVLKETGRISDVEIKLYSKTGELHTSVLSAELVKVGSQEIILSVSVDITERKKAEEALKESEAFNSSLLRDAPNPILVLNVDHSIRYINPAFESLTGYTRFELEGLRAPFPWWPENKSIEYETENAGTASQEIDNLERRIVKKNGESAWITVSARHIREEGKIKYHLITWSDITKRKKAEEVLTQSEAKFGALAEQSPNMIFINTGKSVAYVNRKCEEVLGYSRAEFCSPDFNFMNLIAPESKELLTQNFARRKRGEEIGAYEYALLTKRGRRIESIISISAIEYENGPAFLGMVTDITQRKKMEEKMVDLYQKEKIHTEELQEEARTRGLFINVLAHELRTPVTPILASTGMLKDILDSKPDTIQKKLVDNIYVSTQTLARRLEELLDSAKYSRGAFNLQTQPTDIRKFFEAVIARFKPMIDQRGQTLTINVGGDLPVTEIDPSRMEQVIINLLSNASKFSPDGGTIIFRVAVKKDNICVDITDEGVGIPAEEQARLFQPYHRVEQDRQQLPGLGLGLAVSKQIIEAHGGKIWVDSKPGQGSTFSFKIPIKR